MASCGHHDVWSERGSDQIASLDCSLHPLAPDKGPDLSPDLKQDKLSIDWDCFSGVDQNDQNVQTVGNIIKGKDITLTMTNKGIKEIFVALGVFLTTFMRPPASTFILFQGIFWDTFFVCRLKCFLRPPAFWPGIGIWLSAPRGSLYLHFCFTLQTKYQLKVKLLRSKHPNICVWDISPIDSKLWMEVWRPSTGGGLWQVQQRQQVRLMLLYYQPTRQMRKKAQHPQ